MSVQRLRVAILADDDDDDDGTTVERTVESDVPDFVAVHGALGGEKAYVREGAPLAVTFRAGTPLKGLPAFVWSINGERGELLLTSQAGPYLHADAFGEPVTIELHDHETDEVVRIEWDWDDWQKELPVRSRIVADVYERYARWVEGGKPAGKLAEEDEWPRLHDGF